MPKLSRLVGSSAPCVCTGLGNWPTWRLRGPKCDARARWDLTPQGQALAASAIPPLDNLDLRNPDRARCGSDAADGARDRTSACRLTMRSRIDALIERGLAAVQDGKFVITNAGGRARPRRLAVSALGEFGARQSVNREGRGGSPRS